jgi:PadR family transcriptional regulator, regulatory protein PadR
MQHLNGVPLDTSQLLKGVLDLAVLAVLAEQDSYGYDVLRRLRESGLEGVGDASVYGTLRRLYQAGALKSYVVPSDEGPHRKYYGLNDRGRKALDQSAKTWGSFTRALDQLLNGRSTAHAS